MGGFGEGSLRAVVIVNRYFRSFFFFSVLGSYFSR